MTFDVVNVTAVPSPPPEYEYRVVTVVADDKGRSPMVSIAAATSRSGSVINAVDNPSELGMHRQTIAHHTTVHPTPSSDQSAHSSQQASGNSSPYSPP
jgi:hypothetical protein